MNINPDQYMREGGEKAVINKALEFFYDKEERKQFPNAPNWLFESKHEPKKELIYQS
jgi:hypothetical protein